MFFLALMKGALLDPRNVLATGPHSSGNALQFQFLLDYTTNQGECRYPLGV